MKLNKAPLIIAVPSIMRSFSSWVQWGRVAYTLDRKKSGTVKSGERGGQGVSPDHEIKLTGNICLRKVILCLAVWAVATSC